MKYFIVFFLVIIDPLVRAQEADALKIEVLTPSLSGITENPGLLEFAAEYADLVMKYDMEQLAKLTYIDGADQSWRETDLALGALKGNWRNVVIKINLQRQPLLKVTRKKNEVDLNSPALAVMDIFFDVPNSTDKGKCSFYVSKIKSKWLMVLPK